MMKAFCMIGLGLALLSTATAENLDDIFDYVLLQDSQHSVSSTNVTKYYCMMRGLWNPQNHPASFPPSARMSSPLIYSAVDGFRSWELGQIATLGVKETAETGATDTLLDELAGAGYVRINGM